MPIQDAPLSNKMHAVPQNFMDVEFKLIGDLTMRQFTYLMIGGVTAYLIYATVGGVFKWPLVLFFVILGLSFAFLPIQERGLDVWLVNLFKAIYSPTLRVWKKVPIIPSALLYENLAVVKQELITLAPTSSRRKLEEYLQYQLRKDTYDPLDIPEKAYILKVKNSFADMVPDVDTSSPVGNTIGVSVLEPEPEMPNLPFVPEPTLEPTKPSTPVQPDVSSQTTVPSVSPVVSAQPNASFVSPVVPATSSTVQDNIEKPVKKPFFELPKIDLSKKPEEVKVSKVESKKEVEPLFNVKPVADVLRDLGRASSSSQVQNTNEQKVSIQPQASVQQIQPVPPIQQVTQPKVVPVPQSEQPKVMPTPQVMTQPVVSPQPQVTPTPQVMTQPVVSQQPQVTPTPEATQTPRTTTQPQITPQPQVIAQSAQKEPIKPNVNNVNAAPVSQPNVNNVNATSVSQPTVHTPKVQDYLKQNQNVPETKTPVKHSLFKRYPKHQTNPEEEPQLSIMTPDMHSGRRFTNLLPSKGELVLPIRGERVLKTTEELNVEESMREKAEKLQLMMNQLKNSQSIPKAKVIDTNIPSAPQVIPTPVVPATVQPVVQAQPAVKVKLVEPIKAQPKIEENSDSLDNAAQKIIDQLKQENEKLSNEIKKLHADLDSKTEDSEKNVKEEMLKKLEAQHRKNSSDYSSLIRQIHELRSKLIQKPTDGSVSSQEPVSQAPRFSSIQPLSTVPNVVTGIVKDDTGKDREGILLIIKNDRGEPVRAIKTNALGQFVLSTPLQKGIYTVEVNSSNIEGQTFDIISVEVNGEVIPPLEIIGKKK